MIPSESNIAVTWLCEQVKVIYPDIDANTALHQSDLGKAFTMTLPQQFSGLLGTCQAPPHLRKGNLKAWRVCIRDRCDRDRLCCVRGRCLLINVA
jgi:hypothetical protein